MCCQSAQRGSVGCDAEQRERRANNEWRQHGTLAANQLAGLTLKLGETSAMLLADGDLTREGGLDRDQRGSERHGDRDPSAGSARALPARY